MKQGLLMKKIKLSNRKIFKTVFIVSIILFAIYLVTLYFFNSIAPQTAISREMYKNARKYQERGEFKAAYDLYSHILPIYSAL